MAPDIFCDLIVNEDGLKAVVGCVNEHHPAFVIKLFEECYEVGFNEPGSLTNYIEKLCQQEVYRHQFRAMFECLDWRQEAMSASGFTQEEMKNASSNERDCLIALIKEKDSWEVLEEAVSGTPFGSHWTQTNATKDFVVSHSTQINATKNIVVLILSFVALKHLANHSKVFN